MPEVKGSLQGLMAELWVYKKNLNANTKLLDNASYDQVQGMKALVKKCELYCLYNGIYADVDELEEEEFKATRVLAPE